jgi:agmatine deiminase
MKKYFPLLLCLFHVMPALAQESEYILPKGFAPGEKQMMQQYLFETKNGPISTPPSGSSIRTMAEWEEIQALTITWTSYLPVLREIIKAAQKETKVIIICSDSTTVKNNLISNGVPLVNVKYLVAPFNSVWIRDYGQNSVYLNDVDSLVLVDWKYNRPRPKDDTIPRSVARFLDLPIYQTTTNPYTLVNTGGNFMADGFGTGFASRLVSDENSTKTDAQINDIMKKFMGLDRYVKMTVLPYDDIHHIDMHMKLLDEETLLVGQYPQGVSDGPQIEANIQYVLSNFQSMFGTPYKIVRVPMPPEPGKGYPPNGYYLTYANNVIVNKTIIVPNYYAQYDTTAMRIIREAMPGYEVVGVNSNSTISAGGSLHCITHSVGVSEPLLISHQSLVNTTNTVDPYRVDAKIMHKSGIASAQLYYKTDIAQPYVPVSMTLTDAVNNTWTGYIPAQQAGTDVYYYVKGDAVSGKSQVRPMPAPAGYWKFKVLDSVVSVSDGNAVEILPVYPNPSKGLTCVPVKSSLEGKATITLYDITGREIDRVFEGEMAAGEKNYFINTLKYPSGAYYLVLSIGQQRATHKLMIK